MDWNTAKRQIEQGTKMTRTSWDHGGTVAAELIANDGVLKFWLTIVTDEEISTIHWRPTEDDRQARDWETIRPRQ